jgi:GH15 family glucan-1,4-alpha-glucosidase
LIGDCHTAALVSSTGSIDWLCPDRFDAPAVFCRLLDWRRGGFFSVAPVGPFSTSRRYVGETNVLETTFSGASGSMRLVDLMPVHPRTTHRRGYDVGGSRRVLRLLEGLSGELEVEVAFKPTFDFARERTEIAVRPATGAIARAGGRYLALASRSVDLHTGPRAVVRGRLRLRAGEHRWLVLTSADDPDRAEEALAPVSCDDQLARTVEYWQGWSRRCTYRGRYRAQVLRSALVLKLLTYEPTGALVAAPTTSLPEEIGGQRNWDYRFTWLRDASLTLYALLTIGYTEEAADFLEWLEQSLGSDPTRAPQIMYGIDGRRELPEHILDHLEGYRRSRPVRIGNAAADQRQFDIYGDVLRAAALQYSPPVARHAPSQEAWAVLRDLVQRAADNWDQAGNGIWEVRGGPQPFLYGRLMCWAALQAGERLATTYGLEAPLEAWRTVREEVRQAILEHGYDPELGAFTQAAGSSTLDASSLIIPRIGFLPPTDPRVQSTIEAIRKHLTGNGLVYRYRSPDGLPGREGAFTMCTFWLVDALALSGRTDEARALFEQVLDDANDVGLLAEEIDPETGELLGNFPQGFSHLALIGAAVNLAKVERRGAERQPKTEAERLARDGVHTRRRHH